MKSVLYAGTALMIGAAIYGFADYKKTNSGKEFNELYREKAFLQPTLNAENKQGIPLVDPAIVAQPQKPAAKGEDEKGGIKKKSVPVLNSRKSKKAKQLDSKLFSRAPLRELPVKEKTRIEALPAEKTGQ
jgi:hypothetical protein